MLSRKELIKKAVEAKKNAYCPYSKFQVGAALVTDDNTIFTGCNVENISYGLTICAERSALFKAVSEGHRSFKAIAISSSGSKPTFPCGACRQVLAEFGDITVYVDKDQNSYKLSDLIPNIFSEENLSQNEN